MELIAAGKVDGTYTLDPTSRSGKWYVSNGGSEVDVTFNDRITISIPASTDGFVEVQGDYQTITTTGEVFFYVLG